MILIGKRTSFEEEPIQNVSISTNHRIKLHINTNVPYILIKSNKHSKR